MDKEALSKEISLGKSMHVIAREHGLGYSTVRYWIKKHNIQLNTKNGKNCCVCNKELIGLQAKYCSRKCQNKVTNNVHNIYKLQQERGLERKLQFIKEAGGKCSKCGYNKNIAALCFHHVDPSIKELRFDLRHMSNNSLDTLTNEFNKCILLCHNCHNELHYPQCNNLLD